jgi:hypothetical protein
MSSGVSLFLVYLAFFCAVGIMPVRSGVLTPCEGVPSSAVGEEHDAGFGLPRELYRSAWGHNGTCFANFITGVASVHKFSYLLAPRSPAAGTAPSAHASILGTNAANDSYYSALASVDITDIPTQGTQYAPVVATFPHPYPVLNASASYLLAFCVDSEGTQLYNFGSSAATPGSFIYCPDGCDVVSSWTGIEQGNNTLSTNITFTCETPSAATSLSPLGSVVSVLARALLSFVL